MNGNCVGVLTVSRFCYCARIAELGACMNDMCASERSQRVVSVAHIHANQMKNNQNAVHRVGADTIDSPFCSLRTRLFFVWFGFFLGSPTLPTPPPAHCYHHSHGYEAYSIVLRVVATRSWPSFSRLLPFFFHFLSHSHHYRIRSEYVSYSIP